MSTVKMDSERLAKWERYFLIGINLIFEVLGVITFGWGLLTIASSLKSGSGALAQYTVGVIVGGFIIAVVSVIGCLGARKENTNLLKIYAWILIVLVGIRTTFVIHSVITSEGQHTGAPDMDQIKEGFDKYGSEPIYAKAVDQLQQSLHCCGYAEPESMKMANGTYPSSCCPLDKGTCYVPYTSGCQTQINQSSSAGIMAAKVIFYVIPVIQIVCIIAAFHLAAFIQGKTRGLPLNPYANF